MENNGRPAYDDNQYRSWLEEMRSFLVKGCSLYYAIDKSGLKRHQSTIYEKYRLNDWFSQEVDTLRSKVGETVNEILARQVYRINDRQKTNETDLSKDDADLIKFMAEKHRTAQPFFANRNETAEAPSVGKILDELERNTVKTDYNKLGPEIAKQSVATDPPVQSQEQTGPAGNVPAQPNPAETPNPTG